MQALVLHAKGEELQYQNVEMPILGAHQVLIRLSAAALNRRDGWIQLGQYAGLKFPIILGSDGAGIVSAVGEKISTDYLDKEVILNPGQNWGENPAAQSKQYQILGLPENGTFAEYVAVDADRIQAKPAFLSWEEAAALPLAGLTAWRALMTKGAAKKGDKVLITGIGGGVALFALQFAVALGCEVWVSSGSEEKITKAISLGAKGGVNYKTAQWAKSLKAQAGDFSILIDSAGGEGFTDLVDIAAPGAKIVFYGGTQGNIPNLSPQKIFWKQLSLLGSTMGTDEEFAEMLNFVNTHQLRPVIDSTFPLPQGNQAIARMNASKQFGKIVLTMK